MQPQRVLLDSIKENPKNPRTISPERFKKLIKSIQDFPEMLTLRPLVINSDRVVLGGNMRLRACREAGLTHVPIIIAGDLSEAQQDEFVIKDNIGYGEWDVPLLQENFEIEKLIDWGLELQAFKPIKEDDYEVPDDIESIQTDIKPGDIIEIGRHRLMCGDSTNPQHVEKLLAGAEPYLMITDPPYGVEYDADWRNEADRGNGKKIGGRAVGKVQNDDRVDWSETFSLSPAKVAYVWHAGKFSNIVADSLVKNDFEIRNQLIWVKSNFAISRGNYHWMHEPCWYAVKRNTKAQWCGDRKQTTVWEIAKPGKSETGHSTQKPVECMARPMRNHTGDVYDPFIGSGTTMVAAEQLDRTCYAMEINAKYCQIVVDRMAHNQG